MRHTNLVDQYVDLRLAGSCLPKMPWNTQEFKSEMQKIVSENGAIRLEAINNIIKMRSCV